MTTATTRRAIKAEIARMRQNEEAQGQWCTCGHSLPTHDVGYTCQSTACKCLVFRPSNADTQPPAPVGTPTPTPWEWLDRSKYSDLSSADSQVPFSIYRESTTHYAVEPIADICNFPPATPEQTARQRANAALIVQAVNTYTTNQQRIAELEAALADLVKWMDDSGHSKTKAGGKGVIRYEGHEYQVVTQARQVLNRGGER